MDDEAFEQLTRTHRRELFAHCYRMLGSIQDAEDAVQESLLAAWRGLPGFDGRSSLRTWLYRVTTNVCLRMASRRPPRLLSPDVGTARSSVDDLGEPLAADIAQTVTLYAVVRPAEGRPDITASLAVVRDRQTLVTAPVTMAKAGEDGFIRQLIRLPLPALAAGSYTIRLDLSDGQNRTSRAARVTLSR